MYTDPNEQRVRPHGPFYFLGPDDYMHPDDLCRMTHYDSPSDYVDYSTTREMDWRRVSNVFGACWGEKKLKDIDFIQDRYEFIRFIRANDL